MIFKKCVFYFRFGYKQSESSINLDPDVSLLSAFHTKTEKIFLEAKAKTQISITYLPLQFVKHSGVILFTNAKSGEFLYHLEGSPLQPDPTRTVVDEATLDPNKIKYIKSSRFDDKTLTFRCFMGDRIEIKLLVPVCNAERENAVIQAAEQRMSDLELKRRKIHGVLSSKSLLESIERLTVNNNTKKITLSRSSITKSKDFIRFNIQSKNSQFMTLPQYLEIGPDDLKSDENMIPLVIKFSADRTGYFQSFIELKSLPDDFRVISIDFRVSDNFISDTSTPTLYFNSCVFDPIVQPIPIVIFYLLSLSYFKHFSKSNFVLRKIIQKWFVTTRPN